MIKYLLPAIACFVTVSFIKAQTNSDVNVDAQFRLAINMFDSGEHQKALEVFNKIVSEYDYNTKTTASEFFKTKIYFEQEKIPEVKKQINRFLELYPNSVYTNEIKILLVKYNLEVANYYNAYKEAISLIDFANSDEYESKARKISESIALTYLNENQLQRAYDTFSEEELKALILLQMGKVLLKSNDNFNAKSVLNELLVKYPNSREYAEAKRLVETDFGTSKDLPVKIVIGIMLPLETSSSGEYTSATPAEILEGIKYSLHEFNKSREEKVGLLIRDTKGDVDRIENILEEFYSISSVRAILGPIYSNEVRATLNESDFHNLAIISPTATDDDLTELSENFFQANPSFSVRGRVMAQYLYYVENKRNISVLNSIDGYSPLLAANFMEEFEQLGGTVLRKETYSNSSISFDEQVSKIYADSLILEGIYIPLSENAVAPMILASLVQFKLDIPVYGNQDWLTAKGFETSLDISNNLTFTSDYFFDYQSEDYYNFNSEFNSVTGKDINRNILYGYDAAKYLLTVIRNIEPTRANIKAKMISGMISTGYHNNISLGKKRINRFLNIVRYKDGVFQLVDKFRLNE